jgi:uncharacterized protein YxjI
MNAYELQTITDGTPLLYQDILEHSPVVETPEEPRHKATVLIENSSLDLMPPKATSELTTKWQLKHGFMHCSDSSISDEWGHAAFEIKTSGFFLLDMSLLDVHTGATISQLKQRFSFLPTFDLYMDGTDKKRATIKMKFQFGGFKMVVSFDNGEPDMVVNGNHFGTKYNIYRGDVVIAKVERKWGQHDYEVAAGEDQSLIHSIMNAADKTLTISRRKGFHACTSTN